MNNDVDIKDLQIAANYIMLKRQFVFTGVIGVIGGIFFLVLAIIFPEQTRLPTSLVSIYLITMGVLSITRPSPVIIIINCITWILIFVLMITITKDSTSKIMYGGVTIAYIVQAIDRYRDFRKKVPCQPTHVAMTLINSMVKDMRKRDASILGNIIELSYGKKKKWSILLGERVAVFLRLDELGLAVYNRNELLLTLKSNIENTQTVTVTSPAIEDIYLEMPADQYERYLAWKGISAG